MRIFLTGGTGFIGSNFLRIALNNNLDLFALRRKNKKTKILLNKEPNWIDSSYAEITPTQFQNSDVLIHLASYGVVKKDVSINSCIQNNVIGPLKLLETARKAGIKKYIIIGSCFEYGKSALRYKFIPPDAPLEPTLAYGVSKAAASISFTQWALENNLNLKIIRLFHVYGEGEDPLRFYPSLVNAAKNGLNFPMTKGEQIRDFMNVKDVAEKLLEECKEINKENNEKVVISNLGSGIETSLMKFSNQIWEGHKAKGEILYGDLNYRRGEIMRYIPDIQSSNIIVN